MTNDEIEKKAEKLYKPEVIKTCAVGPPCSYIHMGGMICTNWQCKYDGLCEYQRPREVK